MQFFSKTFYIIGPVGLNWDHFYFYFLQRHNFFRTKSLSLVCAEKSQETDEESKDKWKLLSELCDSILEDLQVSLTGCFNRYTGQ